MTSDELQAIETDARAAVNFTAWAGTVLEVCAALREAWARIADLEAAITADSHEIEQALGKALNYPELYPLASTTDDGTVCVGEHVPVTIAEEAAKEIERLRAERDALRREREQLSHRLAEAEGKE